MQIRLPWPLGIMTDKHFNLVMLKVTLNCEIFIIYSESFMTLCVCLKLKISPTHNLIMNANYK